VNDLASFGITGVAFEFSLFDQIKSRHGFSWVAIAANPAENQRNQITLCFGIE
jgi:hypothetical protein